MSDSRAKDILDLGDRLFAKKDTLNSLHQEIAEHFYVERATFTTDAYLGRDFAAHVMDSHPMQARRELGDSVSATLRPRDQQWFKSTTLDEDTDAEPENARGLEYVTKTMRSHMYDPRAKFVRATKEGDHDFITFGQAVISVEESYTRDHLYLRNFHLRDCAWLENPIGDVDHLHRREGMTARTMKKMFGEKVLHRSVKTACEKEPGREFKIRVVCMPADEYDYSKLSEKKGGKKLPFMLVYIDAENMKVLREAPAPDFLYVVPRWRTISGSQYAFSPCTVNALPDGRMSQNLARILLEAGEKMVDPPMLARSEAIREVNLQAGSLTWADLETDQKLSEAAQPFRLEADMQVGFAMRADLRAMVDSAFFINKLRLPQSGPDMTATQVRALIEEHIRNLLPVFEPMEHEYNMRLLDKVYNRLAMMQKFDAARLPDALSGAHVSWSFKNPLQEASSRILTQQYREVVEIEMQAMEMGDKRSQVHLPKARRDGIRGIGVPATWIKTEAEIAAEAQAEAQEAQLMAAAQQAAAAADVGQKIGDAAQSLTAGGVIPPPGSQPAPQNDNMRVEIPDDLEDDFEEAVA